MSKVIQISLSDAEYVEIQEAANKARMSVMLYSKGKLLSDGELLKRYNELLNAVGAMRNGTRFNIKAVFGTQWASIPKGTRIALGREFFKQASSVANQIPFVTPTVKDAANTQWYIKNDFNENRNRITKTKLYVMIGVNKDDETVRMLVNNVPIEEICKALSASNMEEISAFLTGIKVAIVEAKGFVSNTGIMNNTYISDEIDSLNSAAEVITYYSEKGEALQLAAGASKTSVVIYKEYTEFEQ